MSTPVRGNGKRNAVSKGLLYLVVPKNLLQLFFRNAHPNSVGAVYHEYDGMDVAAHEYKNKKQR